MNESKTASSTEATAATAKKKEVSIQKMLQRSTANSKIDFDNLVKTHGFIKARQMIKKSTIEQHQYEVDQQEHDVHMSFHPLRVKETIKLSTTSGGVSNLSLLDKMMVTNRGMKELERLVGEGASSLPAHLLPALQQHDATHSSHDEFLRDTKTQYALANTQNELLIANADIEEFPMSLADTLHLQTAYLRQINCTRNLIRTLTSSKMPQFSFYHLRYVTKINLSLNKIKRLPDNFGALKFLEELNLAHNQLSKLPPSVFNLKTLHTLDLSSNSFTTIPDEFSVIDSLTDLNLTENLFITFPYPLCKLISLKKLKFSNNTLNHLAILPPLLRTKDMWISTYDQRTGKSVYVNILTKERVTHIEKYSGRGIQLQADLHTFQSEDISNVLSYRRRKMWLSICGVNEWETAFDVATGQIYYQNNISGSTSWTLPTSLDNIGLMETMTEFTIRNNAIKFFPQSFCQLQHLVKLNFAKNRVRELPDNIGDMKGLEHLELSSNELRLLPISICDCTGLKTLLIDDNHLVRLPDQLGFLPNLEKLNVSANRLPTIPFSLGYCKTLTDLIVSENPLEDPPITIFQQKDITEILWYLRNKYMIEKHGKPPMMEYHQLGINKEVTILAQELQETIAQKLMVAKKDGFLNLQLLGLKEIPRQILKQGNKLHKLKVDFNPDFSFGNEIPKELFHLDLLSCKGCKMPSIPENIHIFDNLSTLNLEDNCLECLPSCFIEIVSLTNLNLSKNHLYELPAQMHRLKLLSTLNLESNYLETLPAELGKLGELKVLNVAKNRLTDVPETLCSVKSLKVLNLEKNKIRYLPNKMSKMPLVDLRVGHNLVERLQDELFHGALGENIRFFSCVENNLLELPNSLGLVRKQCVLEADYNPLISPPSYLLSEGFQVVQHYLQIRFTRQQMLYSLVTDEDFELSLTSFSPMACEVLEDGTGFLTPEDLAAFDAAVHEYCNGEFFRCPATAEEIVERLVKLRDDREAEIYLVILRTLLKVLKTIVDTKDERFKPGANVFSAQRPWGRRGELCNVWVVSLAALLRDLPPNALYPNGRNSIFTMIAEALPPIPFPFTVDLLKDSIRLFQSSYGQVADTELVDFPACDCIDEKRGKPKRHQPCKKAAVVICKAIYVEEEVERREIEEDEFLERFEEIESEINVWINTDEGKRNLEREVKRRKAQLREDISLREEMLMSLQVKVKKGTDALAKLQKRKEYLDAGQGIEMHGFINPNEAIVQIAKTQDDNKNNDEKASVLLESIKKLKDELNQDWKLHYNNAVENLIHKYCATTHQKAVKAFRKHAAENRLLRHWDGDDGDSFEDWKLHNAFTVNPAVDAQDVLDAKTLAEIEKNKPKLPTAYAVEEQEQEAGVVVKKRDDEPDFVWNDTDDMSKYKLGVYDRFRKERGSFSLF